MNINATYIGQFVLVLGTLMAVLRYYLGKRKTETPVMASILGFFSAAIPPLALIYLMVLVLRRDLPASQGND